MVHGYRAVMDNPVFGDLPEEVRSSLVEEIDLDSGWDYLKAFPLPRRTRKRLYTSSGWCVNLFSGAFAVLEQEGAVVLNVDVLLSASWDLMAKKGAYRALLWGAMTGRISRLLGGPPCRTFSRLRTIPREGYPGPVRTHQHPFGLPTLTEAEQADVNKDSSLLAKQMWLFMLAEAERGAQPAFLLEHPRDPKEYVKGVPEQERMALPSVWSTAMWASFEKVYGLKRIRFDQGALGHEARKPTTIGSNLNLLHLDARVDPRTTTTSVRELTGTELAAWAPELKLEIVKALETFDGGGAKISKLTPEQSWELHIKNDHVPFRRDCEQCVLASGTGKRHVSVKTKSCYTLSMDVTGPLRTKGRDAYRQGYRFGIVFAYVYPRLHHSLEAEAKPEEAGEHDRVERAKKAGEDKEGMDLPSWTELFGDEEEGVYGDEKDADPPEPRRTRRRFVKRSWLLTPCTSSGP